MAEAASQTTQFPATVNDRRKLQNRIAQRRFRQKKAMEARMANNQLDSNWHDLLNLTPHLDAATMAALGLRLASEPETAIPLATQVATQSVDQNPSWDSQLFNDVFFLEQPTATDLTLSVPVHTAPAAPTVPPSPPSSTSSSRSPGQPAPDVSKTIQPRRTSTNRGTAGPFDANDLLRVAAVGAANDAARLTNGSMAPTTTSTSPTQAIQLSEQLRAQVRTEVAIEWKTGPKHPKPTWGRRDEPWEPLLHTAAKKGNCEIVQMLLEHNANINERNSGGMTALHLAIEYQQEDIIMLLLRNGVDVNAADSEGRTALSMAVNNSCESGVRLFLLHGADPMIKCLGSREGTASP